MDMILISESKLKVMLSPEDMEGYSLTCDNMDYDNTETRRAFWDILDAAKHKTGFDAAADKVFIQVYPCRGGGCEMFVTKLLSGDCEGKNHVTMKVKKTEAARWQQNVYCFETMSDLLSVCRQLSRLGYGEDSRVYMTLDSAHTYYYLAISDFYNGKRQLPHYPFIDEYQTGDGCGRRTAAIYPYINEHCKCICDKDAVSKLAQLT